MTASVPHLRALYVTHKLPVSLAGGWSLRSVANLAALAKLAEVDVVAIRQWADLPDGSDFDASARSLLSRYASALQLVDPGVTSTSFRNVTRRLRRNQALMSALDVHPEIARRVSAAHSEYDIVWLEGTYTAQYAPLVGGAVLTLVDTHNVESDLEREFLLQTRRPVEALRSAIRLVSTRRAERRYLRQADAVIATSERDASIYRRWVGLDRVEVVPNAIDPARYSGLERRPAGGSVLFVGSLDYFPNRNGLRWFLSEVWPDVVAAVPRAHLQVVGELTTNGRFPPSEHVTFAGGVDDLEPYLQRAELSICPLFEGGGTRLKVIEALGAGIPLVATAKGVEGLGVSNGHDVLIADTPAAFSSSVVDILSNPELAASLARRGQETVARRYTWDAVDDAVRDLSVKRLEARRIGAGEQAGSAALGEAPSAGTARS